MSNASYTTVPGRLRRWLRVIAATAMVSTAISACSGPSEGTLTDNPALTPSETPNSELAFALEIPEDICPDTEFIPDHLAAPEDIGYIAEFELGAHGSFPHQECTYSINGEIASLDGVQAIEKIALNLYITDGSPLEPLSAADFSPVDFEKTEAAEYFYDWDQAEEASEIDFNPIGKGLKESYLTKFQFYALLDNLYVYAYISFVSPDEDLYTEREIDTDEAAYQILESIVAPAIAGLDRQ